MNNVVWLLSGQSHDISTKVVQSQDPNYQIPIKVRGLFRRLHGVDEGADRREATLVVALPARMIRTS